jgi:hypothetical protein
MSAPPGRSLAAWPYRPDCQCSTSMIVMGDTMAHIQYSAETSPFLLQAKDFLVEARRLKPGPARNELREVAKVLRELAEFEIRFQSASARDRPGF